MLSQRHKRAIRGMALGDGCCRCHKGSYSIAITHSVKQKQYLEYKLSILEEAFERKYKVQEKMALGKYPQLRIEASNSYLKWIWKRLYPNGDKKITMRYLRSLDDHAVAIWYMDDGNLYHKKRNGKVHASDLQFSLYATEEEANIVIQFFEERYGVRFRVKRNKGKFSVVCYTQNAKKLLERLNPWIIDSMRYKTFCTGST